MTDSNTTGHKSGKDGQETHDLHEYAGGYIKAHEGVIPIWLLFVYFGLFFLGVLLHRDLLGRSRAGPDRLIAISRAEIKAMLGVKFIFGVAVVNLMFLGFELVMNVIRTVTG